MIKIPSDSVKSIGLLLSRKLIQTGERQYMCYTFDRTFIQIPDCYENELIHKMERTFVYLICDKIFIASVLLL